jgi:hypothetical protein
MAEDDSDRLRNGRGSGIWATDRGSAPGQAARAAFPFRAGPSMTGAGITDLTKRARRGACSPHTARELVRNIAERQPQSSAQNC